MKDLIEITAALTRPQRAFVVGAEHSMPGIRLANGEWTTESIRIGSEPAPNAAFEEAIAPHARNEIIRSWPHLCEQPDH